MPRRGRRWVWRKGAKPERSQAKRRLNPLVLTVLWCKAWIENPFVERPHNIIAIHADLLEPGAQAPRKRVVYDLAG